VIYEFWEPGPGEQRLFEMAQGEYGQGGS